MTGIRLQQEESADLHLTPGAEGRGGKQGPGPPYIYIYIYYWIIKCGGDFLLKKGEFS